MRLTLVILVLLVTARPGWAETVTFDDVARLAAERAAAPFRSEPDDLPARLRQLTYEECQAITFRADRAIGRAEHSAFQLQLFPRGGLHRERVNVHVIAAGQDRVIGFDRDFFDYGGVKDLGELGADLGYAGVKLLYPVNRPGEYDEVVSFLGASYFRAVGAGQRFGLSARGLAVDSALADRPEEFPRFVEFWLRQPDARADTATLYALLDGPSVTGAYEFVVRPGKDTVIDVRARVLLRGEGKLAGFAPLTSMFWYGENTDRPSGELRPEVHDSDGLLVKDAGAPEVWCPLHNPAAAEAMLLPVKRLVRFGLLQRDRAMANYEDLEARYVQRPSAWIEPVGEWGAGTIHLRELPARREYADNVVAYWVPERAASRGQPIDLRYRMAWSLAEPAPEERAEVVATREGPLPHVERGRLFWIDFTDRKNATRNVATLDAEIAVDAGGRLRHHAVSKHAQIGGWRVAVEVDAERTGTPIGLRCHLREGREQISETWRYSWTP